MNVAVWPASFWVTWITVLLCVVAALMVGAMIVEWWQYTADKKAAKAYLRNVAIVVFWVVVFALLFGLGRSNARDNGQWENNDPVVRQWLRTLMQPDNPSVSCCGESDAYWCDTINVRDGKTYCTITDDRDDLPLQRPHVPIGTVIEIPDHKLTWKDGNPTGHQIVFLSSAGYVWCFVQGTGI